MFVFAWGVLGALEPPRSGKEVALAVRHVMR